MLIVLFMQSCLNFGLQFRVMCGLDRWPCALFLASLMYCTVKNANRHENRDETREIAETKWRNERERNQKNNIFNKTTFDKAISKNNDETNEIDGFLMWLNFFHVLPPLKTIFVLKFQWRNERWRISRQKLNDETNENDFHGQIILTKRDEIFVNESFVRHWRTICVP